MTDQDELFTQSERPRAFTSPAQAGPALIATCRSNVLEWLSTGLLTPRAAFDKYYEDSLAIRDDLIPVVRPPMGTDLLEVEAARTGNFPVLVELDEAAVTWVREEEVGYLARSLLDVVRALHFRSRDDAEEFSARGFANLSVDRVPHRVSPGLFDAGAVTTESVSRDLGAVRRVDPAMPFPVADRLSGGLALALAAAVGSVEGFGWMLNLTFGPRTERPPRKKLTLPHEWVTLTVKTCDYAPPKSATMDERIFRASAKAFLAVDRADVGNGPAMLDAVDALLSGDDAIRQVDRDRWAVAVRHIRAVLQGDEAFTGFRNAAFKAEKALLLALIRTSPEGVLGWTAEETHASTTELVLAAMLVGFAHGRKAMPLALRPAPLDAMLANRELEDLDGSDVAHPVEVVDDGTGTVRFRVDEIDVGAIEKPPPTLAELFEAVDVRDEGAFRALTDAALRRGWTEAVKTVVIVPDAARIEARRSTIELTMNGVPELRSSLRPDAFRHVIVGVEDQELRELLVVLTAAGRTADAR